MKLKKLLKNVFSSFENGIMIYIPLKILTFLFQILPLFLSEKIINLLGNFAFFVMKGHRKLALKNINIAFGEKYTKEEKIKICKKMFIEIMSLLETFHLYKFKDQQLIKIAEIEGEEILRDVLKEKKGVIAVCPHMGNFPLALTILCKKGYPVNMIIQRSVNIYADRNLREMRKKLGVPSISKKNLEEAIKESEKWIKNGGILCIYLDQHAPNGIKCEFFGKQVYVPKGAAVFTRKYKTSVIGFYTIRTGSMKHKIIIEGPYKIRETKNVAEDIKENTQFFIKRVQAWVEKYPEQWSSWLNPGRFPE